MRSRTAGPGARGLFPLPWRTRPNIQKSRYAGQIRPEIRCCLHPGKRIRRLVYRRKRTEQGAAARKETQLMLPGLLCVRLF